MRNRDILDNLITFLNVIEGTEENIDTKLLARIKLLFREGHCFSFCVCHAAMEEAGLLEWWEAAIQTIHFLPSEQITPIMLQKKVLLPKAEGGRSITLKELFTRMVNYILFNQSHADERWSINDSQLDFLSGNQHFFELLDKGEIKAIQQNKFVAGNFSISSLETWLGDGAWMEDRICLVHSDDHTIRISFKDGTWKLYDPLKMFEDDYFHKVFTDKRELIKTIFQIQGTALGIEVASFDKQREIVMPEWKLRSTDELVYFLHGFGFHQIANFTPDLIPSIIQFARQSKAVAEEIAYALLRKDREKFSGLQVLATYCPKYLSEIISVVETADGASCLMAYILGEKEAGGDSGFKNLLYNCDVQSSCVAQLLKIALNYKKALKVLGPLLIEKYPDDWNGFMKILIHVPNCAYQVLETIGQTEEGRIFLSEALSQTNIEGYSGFDLLKELAPDCLSSKALSAVLTIINNKRFDSMYSHPSLKPENCTSNSSASSFFHFSIKTQKNTKKREASFSADREHESKRVKSQQVI